MSKNNLAKETSLYLLQHVNNPVNWYPWSEDTFRIAKDAKKPILLSIGYSSCHWCHVMAHESFEDDKTAEIMNREFINIKVDREERPDIDKIYQNSQMILNGRSGGWPLTMFLCHESLIPFFGGTYFPKEEKYNLPSFKNLLLKISEYYNSNYENITSNKNSILNTFENIFQSSSNQELDIKEINKIFIDNLNKTHDDIMGGFGGAPKFPQAPMLKTVLGLTSLNVIKKDDELFKKVIYTLLSMQDGGIHDHLAGGFFRYSVDEVWMIPHFEKMLYDNGQLLECYSKAYEQTKNKTFLKTATEIYSWMKEEMKSVNNVMYTSIDADSEGKEGKFYVWDYDEIKNLLNPKEFDFILNNYGLRNSPNFEGAYHLYISYKNKKDFISKTKKNIKLDNKEIETCMNKLKCVRNKKIPPQKDQKILLSSNLLVVNGMIELYKSTNDKSILKNINSIIEFICERMFDKGLLFTSSSKGKFNKKSFLDDYGYFLYTLLNYLQENWNNQIFEIAKEASKYLISNFYDEKKGSFFYSNKKEKNIFYNIKPLSDEAIPSGAAYAFLGLMKLGYLIGDQKILNAAQSIMQYSCGFVKASPENYSSMIYCHNINELKVINIVVKYKNKIETEWIDCFRKFSNERTNFYFINVETGEKAIDGKVNVNKTTAFLCINEVCQPPFIKSEDLSKALKKL